MRVLEQAAIDAALTLPALIDAIDSLLRADVVVPVRHHHPIAREDGEAMHLIMPAWHAGAGGYLGVKIVNVFPGNADRGLPSVLGAYVLMNGDTGAPMALIDGTRLTLWRTAATSALAARYLARPDAATHLVVGAGALAPFFLRAHRAVRPVTRSIIWNKTRANAEKLAASLAAEGLVVEVAEDLESAVREADIVSTITLSREPLVHGAWLKPGAHLDLVGAFTPAMRETDDDCVLRSRLFVDTRGGVLKEGGDLVQPIAAGLVSADQVEADLPELARGAVINPRQPGDITLYKSTGGAMFDLATAMQIARATGLVA
ncbi:MAG: ornithine cyclodeaminase family protein [Beijerinckiaceae bacterium]|nr:ornithine cyclodeaminase family protein [Beijerinckiaceae bacterium]MCZ8299377.1 ornithine cyclodeaminase family protein [Beijerinckiaceae bacterium]